MYNVTSLVTLAEDISPIMNLLAILAQAIATIGLFFVTLFLWKATSGLRNYAKKQTGIMDKQASHAEKQNDIMDKQITILEDQKEIMDSEVNAMKEDREYRLFVEKYKRLRDEMDKLIAPLYVVACAYDQDKFKEHPGYFVTFLFRDRGTAREPIVDSIIGFWDNVQLNSHLSGSEKLSEYSLYNFEFIITWNLKRDSFDQGNFEDNIFYLVKYTKDRYLQLKEELDKIENMLDMRKP